MYVFERTNGPKGTQCPKGPKCQQTVDDIGVQWCGITEVDRRKLHRSLGRTILRLFKLRAYGRRPGAYSMFLREQHRRLAHVEFSERVRMISAAWSSVDKTPYALQAKEWNAVSASSELPLYMHRLFKEWLKDNRRAPRIAGPFVKWVSVEWHKPNAAQPRETYKEFVKRKAAEWRTRSET